MSCGGTNCGRCTRCKCNAKFNLINAHDDSFSFVGDVDQNFPDNLFNDNGSGLDFFSNNDGEIISFGGGDLSASVDDYLAGSSIAFLGGILTVNADGTWSLTGEPFTDGIFTFEYKIQNCYKCNSIGTVTLEISTPPLLMEIYGDSVLIENGDTTPSTIDDTDFEDTEGLITVDKIYTIEAINGDITGISVAVPTGFTLQVAPSASILDGNNSTFTIRASASVFGLFSGNVIVSSNELPDYEFAIQVNVTIILTGLQRHWDFSDITTLFEDTAGTDLAEADDAIAFTLGKDVAGNLLQNTLANRSLRKDNIQNNLSVGRFDTTDFMTLSGNLTNTDNETIFFVAKHNTSGVTFGRLLGITGTTWGVFFSSIANRFQYTYNSSIARKDGGFVETDCNVLTARYNGTAIARVNGIVGATTATPLAASHTWNTFGARDGGSDMVNGDIGESLVYNIALTDNQILFMEDYLKTKWATP